MADRVPVSITIGGTLTQALYDALLAILDSEGLSQEWDAPLDQPALGKPLILHASEVAWGNLDELEPFLQHNKLPYSKWFGGYAGGWTPGRVIFRGTGQPIQYPADEDDRILIDEQCVKRLGSYNAIVAYFTEAEFDVPPLILEQSGEALLATCEAELRIGP